MFKGKLFGCTFTFLGGVLYFLFEFQKKINRIPESPWWLDIEVQGVLMAIFSHDLGWFMFFFEDLGDFHDASPDMCIALYIS